MPFHLRATPGLIELDCYGTFTRDDFLALISDVEATERALPIIPHRIVTLAGVTAWQLTAGDFMALAARRKETRFQNSFKSALVAPEQVLVGIARMFQTLNDHPQIEIAIFPTREAASEWLQAE
jgi:hypothetical protein